MENNVHMLKGSMFGNNVMNKDKGMQIQKECDCKISYGQCRKIFRGTGQNTKA